MKKIANEQLISKAFQEITDVCNLDKMSELLKDKYLVWQQASQIDVIDDGYSNDELWFEEYYDSITNDCIDIAKENNQQLQEFLSVFTGEDMAELEEQINNYILNNQDKLLENLTNNDVEKDEVDIDLDLDFDEEDEGENEKL